MSQQIEDALVAFLLSDTDVATLIGKRIYPMVAPQQVAFPHATYQQVDGSDTVSNDGAGSPVHTFMQLDLWGQTYPSVKALAQAVRDATGDAAVQPFNGDDRYAKFVAFKGTVGETVIQGLFIKKETRSHEPPVHATETGLFRVMFDIECWWER